MNNQVQSDKYQGVYRKKKTTSTRVISKVNRTSLLKPYSGNAGKLWPQFKIVAKPKPGFALDSRAWPNAVFAMRMIKTG